MVCKIYSSFLYTCILPLFLKLFTLTSVFAEGGMFETKNYGNLTIACPVFSIALPCFCFKLGSTTIRASDLPERWAEGRISWL